VFGDLVLMINKGARRCRSSGNRSGSTSCWAEFRSVVIWAPNPANTGRGSQNLAAATQTGRGDRSGGAGSQLHLHRADGRHQ